MDQCSHNSNNSVEIVIELTIVFLGCCCVTSVQVMTRDVVTLHTTTPIREAVEAFLHTNKSGFPVVDADKKLVGIISLADILWHEAMEEILEAERVSCVKEMLQAYSGFVSVHDDFVVGPGITGLPSLQDMGDPVLILDLSRGASPMVFERLGESLQSLKLGQNRPCFWFRHQTRSVHCKR